MKRLILRENVDLISVTVAVVPLIKFSFIDPAEPSLPPNDLIVIYDRITQ